MNTPKTDARMNTRRPPPMAATLAAACAPGSRRGQSGPAPVARPVPEEAALVSGEFVYLMHVAGCAVRGETPGPPEGPVDYRQLFRLAREHAIHPCVTMALLKRRPAECPAETLGAMEREMRNAALGNSMRSGLILALLTEAEREGLPLLLLKGRVVGETYAFAELRQSCDTDVLVSRKDERRALSFLKRKGFTVKTRTSGSHHSICWHPLMGMIELHVGLFSREVRRTWFRGVDLEALIPAESGSLAIEGHTVRTLGETGHMLFLALHLIEHLTGTGAGLGMILDIGAFLTRHANAIDMDAVLQALSRCGCAYAFRAVLRICGAYCGFSTEAVYGGAAEADWPQVQLLLADLERGGRMGAVLAENRCVSGAYIAREKQSAGESGTVRLLLRGAELARQFRLYFLPTRAEIAFACPHLSASGVRGLRAYVRYVAGMLGGYARRRQIRTGKQGADGEGRMALLHALKLL